MSVSRNLVYNVVINVLNVVTPLITVPYTSRVMGVDNVGVTTFALTYAAYFALFIQLGIPTYGTRLVAQLREQPEQRDKVVSELFRLMLYATVVVCGVYVATIYSIDTLRQWSDFLLIAGVTLVFMPFSVDWYFTGRENLGVIAWRNIAIKTLGIIGIFTLVKERSDVLIYLGISVFIAAGSQLWFFVYMLREVRLWWRGIDVKQHVRPILVLFSSLIAVSIYTMLDTLMLGFMSSETEVGYYGSATKVTKILMPFVIAASAVMFPRLSHLYKQGDRVELQRMADKSFSFMSILAPPITLGTIAVAPVFIPFFMGPEFLGAVPVLMVMALVIWLIGINNFYGAQVLLCAGKDKMLTYAVLGGTISNFALNLVAIPFLGAIGAALASVAAESVVVVLTAYYVTRHVPLIRPSYKTMIHASLSSLPMLLYGYIFVTFVHNNALATLCVCVCSVVTFCTLQAWVFRDAMFYEVVGKITQRLGPLVAKFRY